MNTSLEQKAAVLEANGWQISCDKEKRDSFKAVHRSLSNGEIVVSVVNGKVVTEPM